MTKLEFLNKYLQFKITEQHLSFFGGGVKVQVYNTTFDPFTPVFEHFISDFDLNNLLVDYDTVVLIPIINWLQEMERK